MKKLTKEFKLRQAIFIYKNDFQALMQKRY